MSVDITNETQWDINPMVFSDLAVWTMDQMHVSTHSDLSVSFIEPEPMAQLHMRWMNLEGPMSCVRGAGEIIRKGCSAISFSAPGWQRIRLLLRGIPRSKK